MILVAEWPPFGKELLIWFTICSLCIMSKTKHLSLNKDEIGHHRLNVILVVISNVRLLEAGIFVRNVTSSPKGNDRSPDNKHF